MASCRFCATPLHHLVVDLGMSPLCESYRTAEQLGAMEPFYPLRAYACDRCFLVQVEEYVSAAEIFGEYAYFSAYSESWLAHARAYCGMIVERLGLGAHSFVVELGSNDGYLLQYLVARGIPVLGIDPAANVAPAARARGVDTLTAFFGRETARALVAEGRRADLLIGNNVLAQVSDLNGFVEGVATVLAPNGIVTMEFEDGARFVLNRQSAARQIWLAAGARAWHYRWDESAGAWVDDRDGHELFGRLAAEVGGKLGIRLDVPA